MGTALTKYLDSGHALETVNIGPNTNLYIYYQRWGNEQKYMNISNKFTWFFPKNPYLPNILVPQGAYKFVAAMDEMIRELPVDEPKHPECVLFNQMVPGDRHHYLFELSAWHKKGYQCNFEIRSVKTFEEHEEEKSIYLPFSALPELRKSMVKILAEHDGSEQIGEMPAIPEWATRGAYAEDRPCCSRNGEGADVAYNYDGRRK